MKPPYKIVVVGANGLVGKTVLRILQESPIPNSDVSALLTPKEIEQFDFATVDFALFTGGSAIARQFAKKATRTGCTVIDSSTEFRNDPKVPLIIPEINLTALSTAKNCKLIASPNCTTTHMLLALKPIYDAAGITRINICTYQSVSGSGMDGVAELSQQISAWHSHKPLHPEYYDQPIAFNLFAVIDDALKNGYTLEEMRLVSETHKILNNKKMTINPTAVRVPVFFGHCEAIHLETARPLTAAKAKQLLRDAPGIVLAETEADSPTPLDCVNSNAIYVGRVRKDISHRNGLNLWVVADNVRRGIALNMIYILRALIKPT